MAIKQKKLKLSGREKVKVRVRKRIRGTQERPRVSVFRSSHHTYAQLITDEKGQTLISVSTREKEVMERALKIKSEDSGSKAKSTKSIAAARAVGLVLAERSKGKNIERVVFDRNGFIYHGRIQAVADGAREGGLQF